MSELSPLPPGMTPTADLILNRLTQISLALETTEELAKVITLREWADLLHYASRKAGLALEIQNAAAKSRLDAERRAGEMLQTMPKHPGGRPPENPSHDGDGFKAPSTYAELQIDYHRAERWQTLAQLPRPIYEHFATSVMEDERELTGAAMVKYARNWLKKHQGQGGHGTEHEVDCPRCGGTGRVIVREVR